MTDDRCPDCGGILRERGTRKICPRCLLGGAVGGDPAAAPPEQASHPEMPGVGELAPDFPELEIVRLVGAGGMGVVYEARQLALDRTVALKLLRIDSVNPEFVERFQREGKTLAKLDHPNIVRIIDQGEKEGWVYILMEFIEGTDLSELLEGGDVSTERALEIADGICAALEYAHGEGVVHRDIKPANVLIDGAGTVKVADFGLAKLAGHADQNFTLTTGGSSMGTPLYMAPEQRKDSASADNRADIYSAGVVLYEMLAGDLPVGNVRPPSQVSSAPRRLDRVVLKAIEPDPAARYADASAFRAALAHRPLERLGALAVAGVAAVAIAAFVLNRGDGEGSPQPLPTLTSKDADALITEGEPSAENYFAAIISGSRDILAVTNYKANPFFPVTQKVGSAHIYQISDDGKPGAPLILQAERPEAGDLYGNAVAVSEDANWLAVSAPNQRPPDGRDGLRGAVEVYRRTDSDRNQWQREDTVYVPDGFGRSVFRMRINIDDGGRLAVGSPTENDTGAVLVFEPDGGGTWSRTAELHPPEDYSESGFGSWCEFASEGELLIGCPFFRPADDELPERPGRVARATRTPAGGWQLASPIDDPVAGRRHNFGADIRLSGGTAAVNVPGNPFAGDFSPGGIVILRRSADSDSGWLSEGTLELNGQSDLHASFGYRFDIDDGLVAGLAFHGDFGDTGALQSTGHSTLTLYGKSAGGWAPTLRVSGKDDNQLWLGRIVLTDRFLAICHPSYDAGPLENAGAVLVFSRAKLEAAAATGG